MFPHVISYKDLDEQPVEAEFWFSLNESEIAELKVTHQQDIGAYFQRIINADNTEQLIQFYRELLVLAVGRRQGQRMIKDNDVKSEFVDTGAYNALFVDLIQRKDHGAGFINDMFPKDLIEAYDAKKAEEQYTDEQLMAMTNAEFKRVAGDKRNMSKHMTVIAMKRKELNRQKHLKLTT